MEAFKVKIESEYHSVDVQVALFSMGYKWKYDGEEVQYTGAKWLFAEHDGVICYENTEQDEYLEIPKRVLKDGELVEADLTKTFYVIRDGKGNLKALTKAESSTDALSVLANEMGVNVNLFSQLKWTVEEVEQEDNFCIIM